MMLAALPLLVPLTTALLCAISHPWPHWQRRFSAGGALTLLVCSLLLLAQLQDQAVIGMAAGGWPLPFAIELAVDRLGAALVCVAALMLCICLAWLAGAVDNPPATPGLHPLLHGLVAGAAGAFITADLFNLYVWFEVALICSLGLLVQGGTLKQLDAALKYFVLNLVGTLLLLTAVALLYGATGQLNFSAVGAAAAHLPTSVMVPLIGLLMLALLIKSAAFPFFAWLPAAYHTLPAPVLALFSALLSKIAVCALIRISSNLFQPFPEVLAELLAWLALLSMLSGVLGAAYHWDLRRILAFHSISQVGYMLLALALASPAGDAAAIFFALHHSLVKAGLVLTAGLIFQQTGHYDLRRIGGLSARRPGLAVTFLVLALSLVGIPPSSGFWGKYLIVRESFIQEHYFWGATALLVGALTFYSMIKIWLEAFWKAHPDADWSPAAGPTARSQAPAYAGLAVLLLLTLWMGLTPDRLISYVQQAALLLRGASL